jgi:hypothetical protein
MASTAACAGKNSEPLDEDHSHTSIQATGLQLLHAPEADVRT